ncbi:MAG: (2Fe-2S)-binding protein [Deltaproteobacteria bacterium]|nr:MAG: (2Fe-2S)-binding protein [Deltaproteobacteria bacterium]
MEQIIKFTLNGSPVEESAPPHWTLLRLLREKLGLTGTKEGCGIGECGSCTVLLDGMPVHSCLLLVPKVEGREVQTIEGLGNRESLHPLQQSFIDHGAVQCGFCTPGILMSSKALLEDNPDPSSEEIKEAISGHLCRCTGYHQIIEAIEAVKKRTSEDRGASRETGLKAPGYKHQSTKKGCLKRSGA